MRFSGILLHPTSLPGGHGIGDLGSSAYEFVDFLAAGGQKLWQILPLGPPAEANSPYKACSSMAGNSLLISLDRIAAQGFLCAADLEGAPAGRPDSVDFDAVAAFKWKRFEKAAQNFFAAATAELRREFEQFCEQQKFWLDSYADFAALRDERGGLLWTKWDRGGHPDPGRVALHRYIQFEFNRQWRALQEHCRWRSIHIIGDLPIFVAQDSSDVWGNPQLFDLDSDGNPLHVAGVPPDYFSATGQLWGNPLYRWDRVEQAGYEWWIQRIRRMLEQVDWIRIDHFRGFEKFYEIPASAENAIQGHWVDGPGDRFFEALSRAFGKLPFIAEDLGLITPEVLALRDRWGFPGMRVLQFAFGTPAGDHPFKPHNYVRNCVAYTGTHDNDTTLGWFQTAITAAQCEAATRAERDLALRYLNSDGKEIHWDFIRAAVSSVADFAIFPMQDALGLGSEARMNLPSHAKDNWHWRFRPGQLTAELAGRLHELNNLYGRL
jgi:4-alpha-glucanotransferase